MIACRSVRAVGLERAMHGLQSERLCIGALALRRDATQSVSACRCVVKSSALRSRRPAARAS